MYPTGKTYSYDVDPIALIQWPDERSQHAGVAGVGLPGFGGVGVGMPIGSGVGVPVASAGGLAVVGGGYVGGGGQVNQVQVPLPSTEGAGLPATPADISAFSNP